MGISCSCLLVWGFSVSAECVGVVCMGASRFSVLSDSCRSASSTPSFGADSSPYVEIFCSRSVFHGLRVKPLDTNHFPSMTPYQVIPAERESGPKRDSPIFLMHIPVDIRPAHLIYSSVRACRLPILLDRRHKLCARYLRDRATNKYCGTSPMQQTPISYPVV